MSLSKQDRNAEAHTRWIHLCWAPPMGRAQTHNPKQQDPLLLCHSSAPGTPLHAPALMCLTELMIHLCCTRVCEPWPHSLHPNPEFCQHRVWDPDEPLTVALWVHPQDSGLEFILCMPTPGTRRPWGRPDTRMRSIPESLSLQAGPQWGGGDPSPDVFQQGADCVCGALCSMGRGHRGAVSSPLVGPSSHGVLDPQKAGPPHLTMRRESRSKGG